MAVTLKPHQEKAVKELGTGKILCGDVGVGKSITAAAYYMKAEAPKDVYVITTAKKRDSLDWEGEFIKFGVGVQRDATVAGVLKVDSWNNIGKYEGVKNAFFIFDEQRVVGSGAWTKSFYKIAKHNHWILLSATPGDTWLDYIPVFVGNGFYKNRTEFLREHVVFSRFTKYPKVDRYIGAGRLVRHRNNILVEMPYQRHTVRVTEYVHVDYDEPKLKRVSKNRWHVFEERPLKDIAELFSVARKVVGTDPTRLSAVEALVIKHPRLIVFYNFDYELEQLRKLKHFTFPESPSTESMTDKSTTRDSGRKLTKITSTTGTTGSDECPSQSLNSSISAPTGHSPMIENAIVSPHASSCKGLTYKQSGETTGSTQIEASISSSDSTCSGCSSDRKLRSEECQTTSALNSPEMISSSFSDSSFSTLSGSGSGHELPTPTGATSWDSKSETSSTLPTTSPSFAVAEWNGHKHEPIPTTERWVYLVQYVAGSEGWNCTDTDAMCFYSLTYSYKNWHQAYGRIDRLNTPFQQLFYYVLYSKSWIDGAIRKSLSGKKTFNESAYAKKVGWNV